LRAYRVLRDKDGYLNSISERNVKANRYMYAGFTK
jgi:hypothetical protein